MLTTRVWPIAIHLTDADGHTHAEAVLASGATEALRGKGYARCDPSGVDVAEIGDELAAARALADLSTQLLAAAAEDVQAVRAKIPGG
ncbi:MAG TPA: dsRBD fold-containing protein [Frankiaceae bacterium]|nr:dsRBD fold-containing protein [Frankiaceae bacterium]